MIREGPILLQEMKSLSVMNSSLKMTQVHTKNCSNPQKYLALCQMCIVKHPQKKSVPKSGRKHKAFYANAITQHPL
jgi:hypothetical protein